MQSPIGFRVQRPISSVVVGCGLALLGCGQAGESEFDASTAGGSSSDDGSSGGSAGHPSAQGGTAPSAGHAGAPGSAAVAGVVVGSGGLAGAASTAAGSGNAGASGDPMGGTASGGSAMGGASNGGASLGGAAAGGAAGMSKVSRGCGANTVLRSATEQQLIQVNGTTRYYLLAIPAGYTSSKPLPLIFAFHGRGGSNVWTAAPPDPKDWFGRLALKEASAGKAILVYPMGSTEKPGSPGATVQLPASLGQSNWNEDPDLAFFDALWADLEAKYCIDTAHVFATGYSMGGAFSNTLGCKRSSVIRAVAPVEGWGPGSPPTSGTPACSAQYGKEAALVIHGMKDGTIPYSVGQATAAFWRADGGCNTGTSSAAAYSTSKLSCAAYQGCSAGHEALFCSHAADHQVPADAGAAIWRFFDSLP